MNGNGAQTHEQRVRSAAANEIGDAVRGGALSAIQVSSSTDFESVYAQHAGFVWRVLLGMGVSAAVVEDAVQDVFVVVHKRLSEFDGRHSIRTWLFAIAYRVACDYRRQLRRAQSQLPLEHEIRDAAPTPAESAEQAEALRVVGELLDQLDDDKRIVVVLTEIEGMTAPEIAEATGTELNTVYTRLRRARLQLNQAMAARQRRTR
jgi:RNA polymerase sigma-70 factor (ECF subfamily)